MSGKDNIPLIRWIYVHRLAKIWSSWWTYEGLLGKLKKNLSNIMYIDFDKD